MSRIPADLDRKLDNIADNLKQFARNQSSGAYKAVLSGAYEVASETDCNELIEEDADEDGIYQTRLNPPLDSSDVYALHREKWTPILRKADKAFDRLCQEFLDAIANDPRAQLDEEDAVSYLSATLRETFWEEIGTIDGDELKRGYDHALYDCADRDAYDRDPYAYHGVSRRDFMASSRGATRRLTASDRSALIRLASTMPVGSAERRAILAGLTNRVGRKVRLDEFVSAFADGDTQLFGPLVSVSAWADAMRAAGAEEYNGFVLDDVASWLAHWGVQAVHPAREFSVALYFKLPPKVPLTKFFRGGNGSCDEFSTMRGGPDGGTQLDAGWYNKPPYAATAAAVAEGAEVWVRMWWD